jgi:glycerol-3-phosphate responsive antiterminator
VDVELPRLLVVRGAAGSWPESGPDLGVLVRDVTLEVLAELCAAPPLPLAVDVDQVEGLGPDLAAARFLAERLGVRSAISRRPGRAALLAEAGILTLLRVGALDSTGIERALASSPPGVGTAISPGLVLPHLEPRLRERLPRPLLAYGLVRTRAEVAACFESGADAVAIWIEELDSRRKRFETRT